MVVVAALVALVVVSAALYFVAAQCDEGCVLPDDPLRTWWRTSGAIEWTLQLLFAVGGGTLLITASIALWRRASWMLVGSCLLGSIMAYTAWWDLIAVQAGKL
jgi:hypothetical protein